MSPSLGYGEGPIILLTPVIDWQNYFQQDFLYWFRVTYLNVLEVHQHDYKSPSFQSILSQFFSIHFIFFKYFANREICVKVSYFHDTVFSLHSSQLSGH